MAGALRATETAIPGLLLLDLPVHEDNRGWFKENWQREKMLAIGLPDFRPVQNNISFNTSAGATRGIHAEPWDKFVSVASGRVFGGWVDLREGPSFGAVFTAEIGPGRAVFVPRGVGNAYQTLDDETAYSYLVNDHWTPDARYTYLNLADETVAIPWPIPLADAQLSDKDRVHPRLADVVPVSRRRTLVVGAGGQVGSALRRVLPDAQFAARADLDVTVAESVTQWPWHDYDTVINASAFTDVDGAESPEGRRAAWAANVSGVANLAAAAERNDLTLVHISSDYVFDGEVAVHLESEGFSPLGVYGQTKAAGDAIVSRLRRHYIVRTSWLVGDGRNFVRTMAGLAASGVSPAVVDDQFGRLTFGDDLAAAIRHLVESGAPYGTYNMSNGGGIRSWLDVARRVYELRGADPALVRGISTEQYFAEKAAAPRPLHSAFDLSRLEATGFTPRDADAALVEYLEAL